MREAKVNRGTSETEVNVELNLDGSGKTNLSTGLPFLEHMLDHQPHAGLENHLIKQLALPEEQKEQQQLYKSFPFVS